MTAAPKTRVALISVGLGRVQRGFERWAGDLARIFDQDPDVELTTYGSGRTGVPGEAVPAILQPITRIVRRLPISAIAGTEEYKRDCLAFAMCILPDLMRKRFDIIHVVDPPLAVALSQLRRIVPFSASLLFTDGCGVPPKYCPAVDHLHHVGLKAYRESLEAGFLPSQVTFVPSGLHTARFAQPADRAALRRKYDVANETFVVLLVSALKRDHKRVDHAIREVSRLPGNVLLWLDGNPEDPEIPAIAQQLLGSRCRITHVPSDDVPELYRLSDVMVHAALTEAFGLTIVEALCSGLTVLTHQEPHFEWLVQDPACHLDMTADGELARCLERLLPRSGALADGASLRAAAVRQRFDWSVLKSEYAKMYGRVVAGRDQKLTGVARALLASKRGRA